MDAAHWLVLGGLLAVVVQVLVVFAASLVPVEKGDRAVGTVTSGVVLGILLTRVIAGALSDIGGWRTVYFTSSVLTLVLTGALSGIVPDSSPTCETPTWSFFARRLRFTAQFLSCVWSNNCTTAVCCIQHIVDVFGAASERTSQSTLAHGDWPVWVGWRGGRSCGRTSRTSGRSRAGTVDDRPWPGDSAPVVDAQQHLRSIIFTSVANRQSSVGRLPHTWASRPLRRHPLLVTGSEAVAQQ
ncbi:MFS transporter [Edaphobacter sp. HDX4]|uniref:MFS transporter n=1 Tax=Edaphobacter sp. HDX4 TaxID=2794064 RepID=UPI003AC994B3